MNSELPDKGLFVAPCSLDQVRKACLSYHYAKVMPAGKRVALGVWEDRRFVGCVIFSRGASPWLPKQWKLKVTQLCELTRVALRAHAAPVSKILSVALRYLRQTNPGLKIVISFADPSQGHHGGIYQAANFVYTGDSKPVRENFVDGRWVHVRGSYWKTKGRDVPTRQRPGKHRYVYALDPAFRSVVEARRVKPAPIPYAKPAREAE